MYHELRSESDLGVLVHDISKVAPNDNEQCAYEMQACMEELAKSMEESAKKENCHDDEVDHIHGRNWRGPRGGRAKRFYIRGTKPDTSVKKRCDTFSKNKSNYCSTVAPCC